MEHIKRNARYQELASVKKKYEETIALWASDFAQFQENIDNLDDLFYIMNMFQSYSDNLFDHVMQNEEEFFRLISDVTHPIWNLANIERKFGMKVYLTQLIKPILSSPEKFIRAVKTVDELLNLVDFLPENEKDIFKIVCENWEVFFHLIGMDLFQIDRIDEKFALYKNALYLIYAEMIVKPFLNDDQFFISFWSHDAPEKLRNSFLHYIKIANFFSAYRSRLLEKYEKLILTPILKDYETIKRLSFAQIKDYLYSFPNSRVLLLEIITSNDEFLEACNVLELIEMFPSPEIKIYFKEFVISNYEGLELNDRFIFKRFVNVLTEKEVIAHFFSNAELVKSALYHLGFEFFVTTFPARGGQLLKLICNDSILFNHIIKDYDDLCVIAERNPQYKEILIQTLLNNPDELERIIIGKYPQFSPSHILSELGAVFSNYSKFFEGIKVVITEENIQLVIAEEPLLNPENSNISSPDLQADAPLQAPVDAPALFCLNTHTFSEDETKSEQTHEP